MEDPVGKFLGVLTFFSRLPLPSFLVRHVNHEAGLAQSVVFFPVAGFVVGLFPAAMWFVTSLFLPGMVAAGLAITCGMLVTGALHEDGLADCADGLGATADRDKALEIMRDSRIGTYGAVALLLTTGLRWAALVAIGAMTGVFALLIAHSASRSAIALAMRFSSYARPQGLGKMASGRLSDAGFILTIAIAFFVALILGGIAGLVAVAAGFLVASGFLYYLQKRLGGYTGDGLGGMQQLAEIMILIVLAGFWQ